MCSLLLWRAAVGGTGKATTVTITKTDKSVFAVGTMLGAVMWRITMHRYGDTGELLPDGNKQTLYTSLKDIGYPGREQFLGTLEAFLKKIETNPDITDVTMVVSWMKTMAGLEQPIREFIREQFGTKGRVTYMIGVTLANMNYYITRVYGYEEVFAADEKILQPYDVHREAFLSGVPHADNLFPANIVTYLQRIAKADVHDPNDRIRVADAIARICVIFGLASKP
jgi:hypothetical protein